MSGRPPLPRQRDLVDGEWRDPPLDGVELVHPDTGVMLARSAVSSTETIDRAVAAATRVHATGEWADRSVDDRVALLLDLANRLEALREAFTIADTIDTLEEDAPLQVVDENVDEDGNLDDAAEDASIIRFVNQVLSDAIELRTSDIHLEPLAAPIPISPVM